MPTTYLAHLLLPRGDEALPEVRIFRRHPDGDQLLTELPFLPADQADPRTVAVDALQHAGWSPAGQWTDSVTGAELDVHPADLDQILYDAADAARVADATARRTTAERDHLVGLAAAQIPAGRIADAVELPVEQVRRIADTARPGEDEP